MREIQYWDYDKPNVRDTAIDMRERSAITYHKKFFSDQEILFKLTYLYPYDSLKFVEKVIKKSFHGTIVEVGAGTGIYSCLLSKFKKVNKIYSVDYSKTDVEELLVFIIKKFNLSEVEENKIIPVVGSFNDIKMPDNSANFIIASGSLHHSEDREKTLNELYRVLKIGGYLVAFERASENFLSSYDLNKKLDYEYSPEIKKKMGYDPSVKYTRRDNSEHDPLFAEWEYLLAKVGFKNQIFWFLKFTRGIKKIMWNFFGRLFFRIFGDYLVNRNLTQISHMKIPYYPWFTKSKDIHNIIIISKKNPYIKMP